MIDFDKHLKAYNEKGNDYRYTFTKEEVQEIKEALKQTSMDENLSSQTLHEK